MHKNADGYRSNSSWPIIYIDAADNRVQKKIFLLCSIVLHILLTGLIDFIYETVKKQNSLLIRMIEETGLRGEKSSQDQLWAKNNVTLILTLLFYNKNTYIILC